MSAESPSPPPRVEPVAPPEGGETPVPPAPPAPVAPPEPPVPEPALLPPQVVLAAPTPARWQTIAIWIAGTLALLGLASSLLLWQRFSAVQEQLARQTADTGAQAVEARTLARKAEETVQAASAKVAILDTRVGDLQAYRAQLDDVLQSVTRVRDENLVVDLESAVRMAQDQARLTGSIEPLLAALRTAERRAQRSGDPRLAPVAVAAARDMERVRTASVPDVAGLLARIDQLLREVDELPAVNSVGKPRPGPAQPAEAPEADNWWSRMSRAFRDEARDLVRVSRVERPEDTMLAPDQIFFIRENLKLRLMNARMGLLARQYEAARSDLAAAGSTLGRYFDPASRRTQAAATLLQQVQGFTREADVPRVDATLNALAKAGAAQAAPVPSDKSR